MADNITGCTRCHAPFTDMRVEIQLQTGVERRRSDFEWEKIANMTLQSREVLCPDCFNKFSAALETLNSSMARQNVSATEIIRPVQEETAPASSINMDDAIVKPFVPQAESVSQPIQQNTDPKRLLKLDLPEDTSSPVEFTEEIHPPKRLTDPLPAAPDTLDEDPAVDELLLKVRYADEPKDESTPPKKKAEQPPRPFGVPRNAVHTSTIS